MRTADYEVINTFVDNYSLYAAENVFKHRELIISEK